MELLDDIKEALYGIKTDPFDPRITLEQRSLILFSYIDQMKEWYVPTETLAKIRAEKNRCDCGEISDETYRRLRREYLLEKGVIAETIGNLRKDGKKDPYGHDGILATTR